MDTLHDTAATPPDRFNEDWRFGRPHVHAAKLLSLLDEQDGTAGDIRLEGATSIGDLTLGTLAGMELPSIGSGYLVRQLMAKATEGLRLSLTADSTAEEPLTICCEANGLYLPCLDIVVESGVHAHILERHVHSGESTLICLRRYTVMPGASLSLELQEEGCGGSRALNISHIICRGDSRVRHISAHKNLSWAREETTAELVSSGEAAPELLLLSANHLQGEQILDQRTVQLHRTPGAKSRLLYKNVVDERACAIFGGNIRVEPGAHETDAYLSNLNMMLSEHATVHSLPGLEILADRVRCSHGSASAPMDPEQLFYLLSRGIDEPTARTMLADGFLRDVWEQFRA